MVGVEQGRREREQARHLGGAERVLAEDLEDVGQERDAAAEEDEPDDVEGRDALGAIVGQLAQHEGEAEGAEGQVDEEDEAPAPEAHDGAAGDGAEHGADERRDRDEGHGANELRLREGPHHREAPHGHHERAAQPLDDAEEDQRVDVRREAAQQGPEREDGDRGREDAARAEAIGGPPARGDEHGEAERVAREHGAHAERGHVQRGRERRHGGVQDRRVEGLHEEGHRDEPGDDAQRGGRGGVGRGGVGRGGRHGKTWAGRGPRSRACGRSAARRAAEPRLALLQEPLHRTARVVVLRERLGSREDGADERDELLAVLLLLGDRQVDRLLHDAREARPAWGRARGAGSRSGWRRSPPCRAPSRRAPSSLQSPSCGRGEVWHLDRPEKEPSYGQTAVGGSAHGEATVTLPSPAL